jgi:hypothetical protein
VNKDARIEGVTETLFSVTPLIFLGLHPCVLASYHTVADLSTRSLRVSLCPLTSSTTK